jgi:mono/diheme cytochrome c family protein
MDLRTAFTASLLAVFLHLGTSCAPAQESPVGQQLKRGLPIYEQGCATETCHGVNGEGIRGASGFRVWPLVGADFQGRNPTAQVIFDVVRSGGEPSLRGLSDQQIYDAIAYEMSLNDVELTAPVVSHNAPRLATGQRATVPQDGQLFPPPGNAHLLATAVPLSLPLQVENSELRMRATQVARAASIGQNTPPAGAVYVLMVMTFEDLTDHSLEVGPSQLRLVGKHGASHPPLDIGLADAVDRFRTQTIEPDHGTAGFVAFVVQESEDLGHLAYTLPSGQELVLEMAN